MLRLPKFDIVSIDDLSIGEIERIFVLADEFAGQLEQGERLRIADGIIMATLFYEPSTRTRLSFESAAHRLGGSVISSASMDASSAAKGETLADTVRVVSGYAESSQHYGDTAAWPLRRKSRLRSHPVQRMEACWRPCVRWGSTA